MFLLSAISGDKAHTIKLEPYRPLARIVHSQCARAQAQVICEFSRYGLGNYDYVTNLNKMHMKNPVTTDDSTQSKGINCDGI